MYTFGITAPRAFGVIRCLVLFAFVLAACSTGSAVRSDALKPPYRPWGILGAKITDTRDGVMVSEIVRGSAAEQAGLRVGDIVTSVGGFTELRTEAVIDHIRSRLPGSVIEIAYTRRGIPATALVTVGEFPRDEQLWRMASAAAKTLDFDRALALCRYFEEVAAPESRFRAPMNEIKASVLRQLGVRSE